MVNKHKVQRDNWSCVAGMLKACLLKKKHMVVLKQ